MYTIIVNYKSLFRPDLFKLVSLNYNPLRILPEHFTITDEVPKNISAEYYLEGQDLGKEVFKSGLRDLGHNALYGDRMEKDRTRSLMILLRKSKTEIELHFFYGFCPTGQENKTFLTGYLKNMGIVNLTFPTWFKRNKNGR